eukprot:124968-Pleurochrysis_carterae.AAC.1
MLATRQLEVRRALLYRAVGLGGCNAKLAESACSLGFVGEPSRRIVVGLRNVLFGRKRPAIFSMKSSCDSVSVRALRLRVILRPKNLSTQAEILLLKRLP